jgi:hypothetical protein
MAVGMSGLFWTCWPRIGPVVAGVAKRHAHHVRHHLRRVGHAVLRHKVTWTCVATVAGGASMWGLPDTPPVQQGGAAATELVPSFNGIPQLPAGSAAGVLVAGAPIPSVTASASSLVPGPVYVPPAIELPASPTLPPITPLPPLAPSAVPLPEIETARPPQPPQSPQSVAEPGSRALVGAPLALLAVIGRRA